MTSNLSLKVIAAATFQAKGISPEQEDSVLADREKGMFVVADGFGGSKAGSEAAQASCDAIRDFLFRQAGDLEATLPFILRTYFSLAGNVLFNALIHANRKLSVLNKSKNVNEKGGASAIAAFLDGDLLVVASVGCCTGWLFRRGEKIPLTVPRSYGRLIDPFAREDLSRFHIPLISLGTAEDLEPEIFEYRVCQGDWLILTSDGISVEWIDKLLRLHSAQNLLPEVAVEESVKLLNSGEYIDNATAAVLVL